MEHILEMRYFMLVKVIYLNGCFRYIQNVKSVLDENAYYLVELSNGMSMQFDKRLTIEINPKY